MQRLFLFFILISEGSLTHASLLRYFKDENGSTRWQIVANFSSTVLILCLTAALTTLFFSHRKKVKANRALNEIRAVLEDRVLERTATLDESNKRLREANIALEGEILQHKETSRRLQASETYLKNILQSMPSMLVGLDETFNVTQWNRCTEEVTGIPIAKALGKNLWKVYPTITIAQEQINEVLQSGIAATIKHSQRGQYYFDIRIFPLQGHLEKGVVLLIDNVTQRTLAENRLIQRDKMSSMGELAATMAHDIDLPLQAITSDLQKIQLELDTSPDIPAIKALISDALERGNQASSVIKNLLAFSHNQGDAKHNAFMTDIVDHAISLAKNTVSDPSGLRFQDVSIERAYEANLPPVPCFVSEMQQVFLSLFRHCVHALAKVSDEKFHPKIRIEISECYDAIWMKVQHNGVGLTAEEQQDLFEPFFNTWPNKTVVLGSENRLSFTHFILTDHHQGQLAITSDIKLGTTFHMQLQLKA